MSRGTSLDRLPPDVAAIVAADLRYFRRFPNRRHRLRIAGRCEIEEARRGGCLTLTPPGGFLLVCGVRSTAPWGVQRVIGAISDAYPTDVSEEAASETFRLLARFDDATMRRLIAWAEQQHLSGQGPA